MELWRALSHLAPLADISFLSAGELPTVGGCVITSMLTAQECYFTFGKRVCNVWSKIALYKDVV